ncbi:MAG: hypothetical protein H6809_07835 [Phycisphaeraceae bacterium]|nr:hypothetical protein [Phycisphaeraceae bacterium]
MRRLVIFLIAGVFVLALVLYMVAYTVRFTERAVLTTFGRADESSTVDAGLHFKWPYPIQRVMTYDTRVRVLQTRQETQQTADNQQVVVQAFCTWRVSDPLAFFRRFSNAGERPIDHFREAEQSLDSTMRTAMAAVSAYRMDQLFTLGEQGSRLADLEQQMLAHMKSTIQGVGAGSDLVAPAPSAAGAAGGAFGIEIVSVGIARVQLPEGATEAVFTRITAQQDRLAQAIQSQGEAEAAAIRSRADAEASQIRVFTENRAAAIRALGERESARFLAQMRDAPELAVFIQQMQFISNILARRVTLIFPTTMPGFGAFEPNYLDNAGQGRIPGVGFPESWNPSGTAGTPAAEPGASLPAGLPASGAGGAPASGEDRS